MSNITNTAPEHANAALENIWEKYREVAATARKKKAQLIKWRYRILILGIVGAILGVLCQEAIRLGINSGVYSSVPMILGGLSAISIGLATFFGKELVNPEQERKWIRCRSTSEALKANAYLFVTNTPPYDQSNRDESLLFKTDELIEKISDIKLDTITKEEKYRGILPNIMSIEQYIKDRIDDQIDFYFPTSDKYEKKLAYYKRAGLLLGIIAVILGALGSTGWTAGWLAVISTIISSIAAYSFANKYQYLIISYQATGNRLKSLKAHWLISKDTGNRENQTKLIQDCEEGISIENSSWMAEVSQNTTQEH